MPVSIVNVQTERLIKEVFVIRFWTFRHLRALPLKIPQGALPLDPTTFEKVDKTFNCHSYTLR